MREQFDDLEESILVSGSYVRNQIKLSEADDIENRIQIAVMERVDTFLEGFRDKLAQSLLANCSHHFGSCQSLLEANNDNSFKTRSRCIEQQNTDSLVRYFKLQFTISFTQILAANRKH